MKVGLVFGGRSGEHEVSVMSARSVASAIDRSSYDVIPLGISRSGKWLVPRDVDEVFRRGYVDDADGPAVLVAPGPAGGAVFVYGEGPWHDARLYVNIDVAMPILHGPHGEDGTVQGLFELMDIPYVGAGVAASAVGMDKALMKALFRESGIPVVDTVVVTRRRWEEDREGTAAELERRFEYPVFVKPANLGSSVGVSKAGDRWELLAALDEAAQYDRKFLVERAVLDAREIECSVLGNEEPVASIPGEVVPAREFYDYEAKYVDPRSRLIIPAQLERPVVETVRALSIAAFQAIDCCGMARVDFFLERRTGKVYVNEINTIPGFTAVSMYPKLWEASGLPYPRLVDQLIELALERHAQKRRNRTSYPFILPQAMPGEELC